MKYPVGSIIEFIRKSQYSRREVIENNGKNAWLLVLDDRSGKSPGDKMVINTYFLDNPENYRFSAEYRIDKLLEKYKN